MVAR
ncbi:hypothetical protein D030_1299A, partial [Vibrio parahaemolyticus AQ3810]|jgi:hypothetical protein